MDLITTAAVQTMTSREIAGLTGKRHPDVKRDIENMMRDLSEDVSKTARIYLDSMNREQTEYALDRELTETLLTGYSAPLRRKVIARWRELEQQVAKNAVVLPDFNNPAIAARAWADEVEAKMVLQAELAAAAPKIEFAEAVRNLDGLCKFEEIAKTLGWGRNKFIAALKDNGILQQSRIPYQKYIDLGYFQVVETNPYTDGDGNTQPTFSTRVTGRGQVWLAKRFKGAKSKREAA